MSERRDWVVVGQLCRCGHPKSDHEYSNDGACAYGWTDEPDEPEPCYCERWEYRADDVIPARRALR